MKKNLLFLAALGLVAFSSCTQSEDEVPARSTELVPVQFGTYFGKTAQVKAGQSGEIGASTTLTDGFGVFAYYTDDSNFEETTSTPNFMYNQKVAKDGTYSPIKYWPNEFSNTAADGVPSGDGTNHKGLDKLTFFAYAPYAKPTGATGETGITALSANTATGAPTVTWKAASDPKDCVDLMYAEENNTASTKDLTKPNITDKVKFTFKHALANINLILQGVFDATSALSSKDVESGTTITVKSLKLKSSTDGIGTEGTFNLGTKTWSGITGLLDFDVTNAVNQTITKTEKDLGGAMFTPKDGDVTFEAVIEYDVETTDPELDGGKSTVTNKIKNTVTFKVEKGKKYKLKLLVGMTTVKFEAVFTDWTTETPDQEVWLPVNKE